MRGVIGILGLVIVVAIVGLLAKKQLQTTAAPLVVPSAAGGTAAAPVTPKQQIDQMKQSLDATLQQPREVPEEKK